MSDSKQIATPETPKGLVAVTNKQDKITKEQLLELVKTLAIFDEDKEINLTKIAQSAGKRMDLFMKSKADEIREIELTQKVVVIQTYQGNTGKQGTYTSNKKVFLLFLSWLSPMVMISMLDIVDELFTKGHTSIDGKDRLTLEEHKAIMLLTQFIQYKDNCKLAIKTAVDELAKKYNGNYGKANIEFNKIADYNPLEIDKEYEQMCLILGQKELRSMAKFDKVFQSNPNRLVKTVLYSIGITNNLDIEKVINPVLKFMGLHEISIVQDTESFGLYGVLELPNQEKLKLGSEVLNIEQ